MKAILNNWWMALLAVIFGGVGWFAKDVNLNGVQGAGEPMALGGLTIGGVGAVLWLMFSRWQAGGGKFDGKVTEKEFDDLATALLERAAPRLVPLVDKVAGPASKTINSVIGPSATNLIDQLQAWFDDATPDSNESVLNAKLLDMLTKAVEGDAAGMQAAATLRARLHAKLHGESLPEAVVVA